MRAVVQRVSSAQVEVEGEQIGAIGKGLLVYLGVGRGDEARDLAFMVKKVAGLRVFADEAGAMNRSIVDDGGALLVVSQFTLYGDVRRGLRPSFNDAEDVEAAKVMVESFCCALEAEGIEVARGRFQASMQVQSINDGPVTILIDSNKVF
jgi:D-aminoacyl-tRNA deacylase